MVKLFSRIRFSLRTLLLTVFLIGAAMTVKWRWEPWVKVGTIDFNPSWPNQAGFTPNGSVYTGGNSGKIELFSAFGLRQNSCTVFTRDTLTRANPTVFNKCANYSEISHLQDIVFSPDCCRLIFWFDGKGCLYDTNTGRQLAILGEDEDGLIFPALTPDGTTAVVAQRSNSQIELFDCESGASLQKCTIAGIWRAWFTPDGLVNAVDLGGYIWQWDWRKKIAPTLLEGMLDSHLEYFSADKRWCISVNYRSGVTDAYLTVFDATTGVKVESLTYRDDWYPISVFAGSILLVAASNGEISRIDLTKKTKESLAALPGVGAIALCNGGQEFAVAEKEKVQVRTVHESNPIVLNEAGVGNLQYSPDGNTLLLGSRQITLYQRRRPNYAWGVYGMPELWLTVLLGVGLLFSIRGDYRSKKSNIPNALPPKLD